MYLLNAVLRIFGQDYNLASHTTHVVCVNFIREWPDLQFNSTPNDGFLGNIFVAGLFTLRVFARNMMEEIAVEIFFSYLVLISDLVYKRGLYIQ